MYNGIGLPTERGSGSNGYVQTNKFLVRPRAAATVDTSATPSAAGAGGVKKPNKELLEHDRKRQEQLRILVLRETLTDQGYTDAEITEKVDETHNAMDSAPYPPSVKF